MTRDTLASVGAALYGPRWQSDLARDLGVTDRTMRRWLAGDTPIAAGVGVDLHRLLVERADIIDQLLDQLPREAV